MTLSVPATLKQHRLALPLLVGVTALSVAACGSSQPASNTSSQPQASGTTTSAPATSGSAPATKGGKDHVAGLIASVTGDTLTVNGNNATSTVGFTSATKISEITPAALTDISVGSCVSVRPARDASPAPDGSVTAGMVVISAQKDSQCFGKAQPPTGSTSAAPPTAPAGHHGVRGTVASVGANTFVVTTAGDSSPTTVDVSNTTTYGKRAPAGIQEIAQGKCVTARGTKDGSGTLQADMINLQSATNGTCPGMKH